MFRWGLKIFRKLGVVVFVGVLSWVCFTNSGRFFFKKTIAKQYSKKEVSQLLGKRILPAKDFSGREVVRIEDEEMNVEYSVNPTLQNSIEQAFKRGQVDYGSFVALDPETGRVVSMVTFNPYNKKLKNENFALRATFPAASVFKIVTATAAVETGKFNANSMIPLLGRNHTLYKRNLFSSGGVDPHRSPSYARLVSLSDALAKSINSVFGKMGIFGVGPERLRDASERFGFNREIPFEMPVDFSAVEIPQEQYALAETASGFTRKNTISPLHGALIAAAISNGGVMMEPSIVQRLVDKDGIARYESEPVKFKSVAAKGVAEQLRMMMHQTVVNGTSRGSFRGAGRNLALSQLYVGGKTGTLQGTDPIGRYDWFVGFAEGPENKKLALAALCIHGKYYGVKASLVARKAFETFFTPSIALHPKAKGHRGT